MNHAFGNYCPIFVFLGLGQILILTLLQLLMMILISDNPDNLLEDDFILQASKPTEEEEGMEIQYVWFVLKQNALIISSDYNH